MDISCWLFAYFAGTDLYVHGLESFDTRPDAAQLMKCKIEYRKMC